MWTQLVLFVISSVASYLLAPKPPKIRPGKIEIPTVEEGRKLGVLFGYRWIKAPHIYWWGDIRTKAIRSKGGKK